MLIYLFIVVVAVTLVNIIEAIWTFFINIGKISPDTKLGRRMKTARYICQTCLVILALSSFLFYEYPGHIEQTVVGFFNDNGYINIKRWGTFYWEFNEGKTFINIPTGEMAAQIVCQPTYDSVAIYPKVNNILIKLEYQLFNYDLFYQNPIRRSIDNPWGGGTNWDWNIVAVDSCLSVFVQEQFATISRLDNGESTQQQFQLRILAMNYLQPLLAKRGLTLTKMEFEIKH